MKKNLAIVLLLSITCACQIIQGANQVTGGIINNSGIAPPAPTLVSIAISPTAVTLLQGHVAQYQATGSYSDASTKDVTSRCNWTTSAPTIASLGTSGSNPFLVTAGAVGTANIKCSVGIVSSPASVVTSVAFMITSTSPLPGGLKSSAYGPVTLTSNGGTLPVSWAITTGLATFNSFGLSMTSLGVISGTPSAAGTIYITVQATDSTAVTPNIVSAQFSITIAAAGTCGPPTYNCSLISTAQIAAPPLPASLLGATPNVGVNLTGNVRGAGFPTSSNIGNCITRMTDKNTSANASVGGTPSGGDNDNDWSFDRSYTGYTMNDGVFHFVSVSYDGSGCLIVNNPVLSGSASVPASTGFGFSRVTGNIAYHIDNTGSKIRLMKDTLSGTNPVTNVSTLVFDYANCPGLPAGFVSTSGGILGVALNDAAFSILASNQGGQGTAAWMMVYKPSGTTCATYFTGAMTVAGTGGSNGGGGTGYIPTGNIWQACSGACQQGGANQAAPLGTETACGQPGFGIHDAQLYRDGNAVVISGQCNGVTNSLSTWVNTATTATQAAGSVVTCNPSLGNCGGHDSAGYNHLWTTSSGANQTRLYSAFPAAYSAPTTVFTESPSTSWEDHGSWLWNDMTDDKPRIEAISTCSTSIHYCNEVFAIKQNATTPRFTASFNVTSSYFRAQDAIGSASQDGYCFSWATTGNDSFGTDASGKPRAEYLAVCNLQ